MKDVFTKTVPVVKADSKYFDFQVELTANSLIELVSIKVDPGMFIKAIDIGGDIITRNDNSNLNEIHFTTPFPLHQLTYHDCRVLGTCQYVNNMQVAEIKFKLTNDYVVTNQLRKHIFYRMPMEIGGGLVEINTGMGHKCYN